MKTYKHLWKILFIVLLIIAIGLLTWFVVDLRNLYKTGNLRPTRGFSRNHLYKSNATPDQIEGWMTFTYINYIFSLPPNYLSMSLNMEDSHYPNLGINKYAKEKNLSPVSFLTSVKEYVALYGKNAQ